MGLRHNHPDTMSTCRLRQTFRRLNLTSIDGPRAERVLNQSIFIHLEVGTAPVITGVCESRWRYSGPRFKTC